MIWASFAREAHVVEAYADQGRRRVDRIHHVVQRARQGVDVFAIERCDEGAVQPLNDGVGQRVALVLDDVDFIGLAPDRVLRLEHRFEQPRAGLQLIAERLEILVELFFAGNQSKGQNPFSVAGLENRRRCQTPEL